MINLLFEKDGVKRGEKPDSIYYDEVFITDYLKEGENTISILVWYFGRSSLSHISSGQGALLFQTQIGEELIVSDASWKAIKNPGYLKDRTPNNERLSETSIYYNANLEIADWYKSDFDDSGWKNAFVCGKAGNMPWGEMIARNIPQFKYSELLEYQNSKQYNDFEVTEDMLIELDLPHNIQFTPYLKIDAPKNLTIQIALDEDYSEQGKEQRTTYVTKDGNQEFESLEWINGEKVYYHIPAGVKIIKLAYRETGYDSIKYGSFKSDETFYNDLWDMAYKTLYVNMRDTYMDCPDRERALWWGDNSIAMQQAMYVFDHNSYNLFEKAAKTQVGWRENKLLMTVVPSKEAKLHLPVQSLIGITAMYDYYFYTGNTEFIEYVYPYVKGYINQWDIDEKNGLPVLTNETNLWKWGDSTDEFDYEAIEDGWYYYALKSIYNMADVLNYETEEIELKERVDNLFAAYNDKYWDGFGYKSDEYNTYDVRSNAVAVLSGLASDSRYSLISKILKEEYNNSTFMEKYVLEALCQMGYIDETQDRIENRYKDMVAGKDNFSTTLWEYWDAEKGTKNHTWAGGPLIIMSKYFAGIRPQDAGYKEILVKPQLGSLNLVECRVPHEDGIVEVKASKIDESFFIQLEIPTKTLVAIEKMSNSPVITCDGKSIYESGKAIDTQNIRYDHKDEKFIYFHVKEGKYDFNSK